MQKIEASQFSKEIFYIKSTVAWVEQHETQHSKPQLLGFALLYPTYTLVFNL